MNGKPGKIHFDQFQKQWTESHGSLIDWLRPFFPLYRSQTGHGIEDTFRLLGESIDLNLDKVPSGTVVGDWTVPKQWTFRSATIKTADGQTIVDAAKSNLHLFNGSIAVDRQMEFSELAEHLSVHPKIPGAIQYRTAFFQNDWGFCVTQDQYDRLSGASGKLAVRIDCDYQDGAMPIAEAFLPGTDKRGTLFWVHTCHPSLADDNLSALAVAMGLIQYLSGQPDRRFSYRFVFGPATIGPITWWHRNQQNAQNVQNGLVLSLLGQSADYHYKQSEPGDTFFDRWFALDEKVHKEEFRPWGYDERQWNSPGIGIPAGRFSRRRPGEFDQYHSSEDNLESLSEAGLWDSMRVLAEAIQAQESNVCTGCDVSKWGAAIGKARPLQGLRPARRSRPVHSTGDSLGPEPGDRL